MDNLQHKKTKIYGGSTWDNERIAQKQFEYSYYNYKKRKTYKQYFCFIDVIFAPTYQDIEAIHNNSSIMTQEMARVLSKCSFYILLNTALLIIDRIRYNL